MQNFMSKPMSYLAALTASLLLCFTTGCASGGFKLTRQYAGFVNQQSLIIRIILYILTAVVFAVTMLIDMVIFNTMDFWEGRTAAGDYKFEQGEKTFQVRHEFQSDGKLRRSTVQVQDLNGTLLQTVVLNETAKGEIEVFVDNQLRTKVHSISELPMASIYDANGKLVQETALLLPSNLPNHITANVQ